MFKWLLHRFTRRFEQQWNYDASYLHEMIDIDPKAARLFQQATALGTYRNDVPAEVYAAAGITAVKHEDCGPCTQLGVSMAEKSGVDPGVLRAVLTGDVSQMPPDVALAFKFTRATLEHAPEADTYRKEIERRWGRRAVLSLAFAILTARLYPTIKYATGHGQTCSRIVVGGAPVVFSDYTAAATHG
ncbi:MAG: hypothetical protein U0Q11_15090 [Vicinamibacterales bacterium]